jgi:hypothetical protein
MAGRCIVFSEAALRQRDNGQHRAKHADRPDDRLPDRAPRSSTSRQIEIAADKATLIAQELVVRKCNASVGDLDLKQKVTITQYDDLKGSVINFMLDKITAILLAIDQSADDCRATPDLT